MLFPEVPLAVAMFENKTADMLKREMLKLKEGKPEWDQWKARWDDLALSYFVIMGGFRVRLEK